MSVPVATLEAGDIRGPAILHRIPVGKEVSRLNDWLEGMRWSDRMFMTAVWPEVRRLLPPGEPVSVQVDGPWSEAAKALDLAGLDFLVVRGRCVTATIASRVQTSYPPFPTLTLGSSELAGLLEAVRDDGLVPGYTVHAYVSPTETCTRAIVAQTRELVLMAGSLELSWKRNTMTGASFAVVSEGQMRASGLSFSVVVPSEDGGETTVYGSTTTTS